MNEKGHVFLMKIKLTSELRFGKIQKNLQLLVIACHTGAASWLGLPIS
jgi:hypothetical protein